MGINLNAVQKFWSVKFVSMNARSTTVMIVTIYFVQETFFLLFTDGRTFYLDLLFTDACRVSDKCKWIIYFTNSCNVAVIEAHFNNIRNSAFAAK